MLFLLASISLAATPDMVIYNGKVWTDGKLTQSTSVSIQNGKIIGLGKLVRPKLSKGTQWINARGNWILPGLIDAHTHVSKGAVGFAFGLDLRPAKNKEDFIQRVAKQASILGPNDWVQGRGWSVEGYPDQSPPSKEWIDEATEGRPAFLVRMDGHSGLANSKALALSGITKDGPPDPPGGRIERDPVTNEPTGLLADTAMGLIKIPAPSSQLEDRALPVVIKEANRLGVTAVADIMNSWNTRMWQQYFSGASKTIRVAGYANASSTLQVNQIPKVQKIAGWFTPRGVKMYMDGSLGSRSAWMAKPFDAPLPTQPKDWRGLALPGATNGVYAAIIKASANQNTQVIIHAIGDQANRDVLNLYRAEPKLKNLRFRVEHVQHLLPADIKKFGELGVIPSMQPYHKADDGRYCESVIGVERSQSSYTFRSLLKSKAKLAFGSDFPVVTINPWLGIEVAVTGKIEGGKIWMPQENISLDQALDSYTRGAAYACKMENQWGRIAPGYPADVLVLDRQLKPDGSNVASTRPAHVIVDGKPVRF